MASKFWYEHFLIFVQQILLSYLAWPVMIYRPSIPSHPHTMRASYTPRISFQYRNPVVSASQTGNFQEPTFKSQPQPLVILKSRTDRLEENIERAMVPNDYKFVSFRSGKWKELKMGEVCERIRQWSIDCGLYLHGNGEPDIFKSILPIWFPHLKKLDLSSNKICNIEYLCFLRVPSLKKLNLTDNCLTSVKPLRKSLHWNSLESIELWGNFLAEINFLTQLKAAEIQEISLDYYDDTQLIQFHPCAKLQSQKISKITIIAKIRIPEQRVYKSLSERGQSGHLKIEVYDSDDDQM